MTVTTKRLVAPILALMVTAGTLDAVAQSKTSSKSKATASKFHRLPAYYGKLKLKEEQIKEIYGIRETFGKKIEAAQKELDNLKKEQAEETKDVLTRTQVTAYNKLVAAAKSGKKTSSSTKKKK